MKKKGTEQLRFSVVIPLYNKEHYIKKTLESVLRQTFQDFEVIVVDDGSVDNSLAEARKIQSPKIRVIEQRNQGVSVARNTGIYYGKGTYIAFLDADDEWRETYLETINNLINQYSESDMFVTAYAVNLKSGNTKLSIQLTPEVGCLESYWLTLKKGYDFVWTSATTIRREALIKAGCFKPGEKIGQDLDMWARVARNNPKVAYSSQICVNYNRAAQANARTRVRIAWAGAFLQDLEEELMNSERTAEEKKAIQKKYDKKMTVYIFTSILAGEKKQAAEALTKWKGKKNLYNRILWFGLWIAYVTPKNINNWIYNIRLKVF